MSSATVKRARVTARIAESEGLSLPTSSEKTQELVKIIEEKRKKLDKKCSEYEKICKNIKNHQKRKAGLDVDKKSLTIKLDEIEAISKKNRERIEYNRTTERQKYSELNQLLNKWTELNKTEADLAESLKIDSKNAENLDEKCRIITLQLNQLGDKIESIEKEISQIENGFESDLKTEQTLENYLRRLVEDVFLNQRRLEDIHIGTSRGRANFRQTEKELREQKRKHRRLSSQISVQSSSLDENDSDNQSMKRDILNQLEEKWRNMRDEFEEKEKELGNLLVMLPQSIRQLREFEDERILFENEKKVLTDQIRSRKQIAEKLEQNYKIIRSFAKTVDKDELEKLTKEENYWKMRVDEILSEIQKLQRMENEAALTNGQLRNNLALLKPYEEEYQEFEKLNETYKQMQLENSRKEIRKSSEKLIQNGDIQIVTFRNLPSNVCPSVCSVCGDRASGYHYEVPSCNGCKTFFRRTVLSQRKYECKNGNKCFNILPKAIQSSTSFESNTIVREIVEKRKSSEDIVEAKTVKVSSLNIKPTVEQTVSRMIDELIYLEFKLEAFRFCAFNPKRDDYKDLESTLEMQSLISIADRVGPMPNWPLENEHCKEENLDELKKKIECGLLQDRKHWLAYDVLTTVEYAKTFPFLHKLNKQDKIILLRAVTLKVMHLHQAFFSYSQKFETIVHPDGTTPPFFRNKPKELPRPLLDMNSTVIMLQRNNLHKHEYVLFKAITLCNPSLTGLSQYAVEIVTKEKEKYTDALFRYCMKAHGNHGPARFAALLALSSALENMQKSHEDFVKNLESFDSMISLLVHIT
ncbi:unnamed protein product [Caenorhabditis bovis]|uniref:Nuclear receptor domain-containing protein n=1 Tax=Caenorhabditis bovis TaxID=2654633 RepID=A0A8S1EDT6_9PELO|nr:unnamed protein product [Caenorhabditis bovis]